MSKKLIMLLGKIFFLLIFSFLIFSVDEVYAVTLSTQDGLELTINPSGSINNIRLNSTSILTSPGGFSLQEINPTSTNLAPNPGFEAGASSPVSWTANSPNWSWDNSIKHGGNRSAKVEVPDTTDQNSSILQSSNFPISPNTQYKFSAWTKVENSGGSYAPGIYVVELDSQGNVLYDSGSVRQHGMSPSKGTADWKEISEVFITRADAAQAHIYANIYQGYGTGWFDDVFLGKVIGDSDPIRIEGTVSSTGANHATQNADIPNTGLTYTANYTAESNHIRIDGQIQDTENRERALQLTFKLPINAVGWTWGDDGRRSRTIINGTRYENNYQVGTLRYTSKYPFSALSGTGSGLSLAVPMDVPRIERTSYLSDQGYQIVFDLGLSPATTKIGPGKATFSIVLYDFEPSWGFRSAAGKYYSIFPQFFTKRNQSEGTWGLLNNPSSIPNISDFSFGFDEVGNENLVFDNRNNIKTFIYIEPWGWWRDFGTSSTTKPSYDARVQALQQDATSGIGNSFNLNAPLNTSAQAVINSSPYDKNGKYQIDASSFFWHAWPFGNPPVTHWLQNYPTNPDPDIVSPNRSQIARQYEVGRALQQAEQTNTTLDGVYLDSVTTDIWADIDNYRQDHWAVADQPLVFSYESKRPVLLGLFSNYDFISWLSNDMHTNNKLIMGNTQSWSYAYFAHFIDQLGSEIIDIESDESSLYRRTMSYQKQNSNLMQWHSGSGDQTPITHSQMEAYMQSSLFYGIYPGINDNVNGTYWSNSSYYERDRDLFRKYMPLIKTINKAGWQPITYARTDKDQAWVERYGNNPSGELDFTVRNSGSSSTSFILTIDGAALRLNNLASIPVKERLSNQSVTTQVSGNNLIIKGTIGGQGTLLYTLNYSSASAVKFLGKGWNWTVGEINFVEGCVKGKSFLNRTMIRCSSEKNF